MRHLVSGNIKIENSKYEYTADAQIHIHINGLEIAKDWIDEDLIKEMEVVFRDMVIDTLVTNKNPYFRHRKIDALDEAKIQSLVNNKDYKKKETLLQKAMLRTKLSEEECKRIITKLDPSIKFN